MHVPGGAQNRIDRAGLDTQSTADAHHFINDGKRFWLFLSIVRIEGPGLDSQQVRQRYNSGIPAWRTLVNIRFTAGDGLRIWPAPGIVALTALGLREDGFYLVDHGIALNLKSSRRPTQAQSKKTAEDSND